MNSTLQYYKENYIQFSKETINLDLSENYEDFLKLLTKKSKILDIGCGTGRDSSFFISKSFDVTSIDPVVEFKQIAKDHFDIDIIQKSFLDLDYTNLFNGIWANASLLHVSFEDHKKVFHRLYRALTKNGVLYCSYKYGNNQFSKNGRKFYSFQKESFSNFIQEKTKFKIKKLWKSTDRRENRLDEYWLNCLLKV